MFTLLLSDYVSSLQPGISKLYVAQMVETMGCVHNIIVHSLHLAQIPLRSIVGVVHKYQISLKLNTEMCFIRIVCLANHVISSAIWNK